MRNTNGRSEIFLKAHFRVLAYIRKLSPPQAPRDNTAHTLRPAEWELQKLYRGNMFRDRE